MYTHACMYVVYYVCILDSVRQSRDEHTALFSLLSVFRCHDTATRVRQHDTRTGP